MCELSVHLNGVRWCKVDYFCLERSNLLISVALCSEEKNKIRKRKSDVGELQAGL